MYWGSFTNKQVHKRRDGAFYFVFFSVGEEEVRVGEKDLENISLLLLHLIIL